MALGEKVFARKWVVDVAEGRIGKDYAEPGMLIGTDSHTPHAGAVGALAFGVGTTAIFNSRITKDVRVRIPHTFKVVVDGTLPANCTAKDLMLEILKDYKPIRGRIDRWTSASDSATGTAQEQSIVVYRELGGEGALRVRHTRDLRLQPAGA